jgi:hypothetical protein
VTGEQRGQRDQLDAVDGGAAQRLVPGSDAERRAAQVHLGTADLGEIGAGQRAAAEADPQQRGAAEIRVGQQAVLEPHVGDRGAAEVHRVQLAVAERDPAHRGGEGLHPGQRAAGQRDVLPAGFGQVAGYEPGVPQLGVGEPRLPQPDVVERGGDERAVQEVAAAGLDAGERGAVELQAVVFLVGFQVAAVRGEIAGHGTDPTGAGSQHRQHPAVIFRRGRRAELGEHVPDVGLDGLG